MSGIDTSGLQLPKLPSLGPEDIRAIRDSWGGKVLGRTAVLLSLVLMLLGSGVVMNKGLSELLNERINLSPLQEFTLFYGVPGIYVACQLYAEWRAARQRRILRIFAVKPLAVPQGFFRVGPYLDTPEDRTKFDRTDDAHEKVLAWIMRSSGTPLYLTGDSGAGKSSLLNAFVVPSLRTNGWTVVEARALQDPEVALVQALSQFPGMSGPKQHEQQDLRGMIESVARRSKGPVLLVLDQFEEFLILGRPEKLEEFAALIEGLRSNPIKKLVVLLAMRSEYQRLLEDTGLPFRQGESFYQVGCFTVSAATKFMTQSDLNLQPQALEQLINSSAILDGTPGLVRPITLNIVGHVLAEGSAVASSMDAGQLTRVYIENAISQPAIRSLSVQILENLITEQGTKFPRSEQDLAKATKFRAGEVRAVLNAFSAKALARPLDAEQAIWELSHDFIARAVARQLGRRKREFAIRAAAFAAPALFAFALVAMSAWIYLKPWHIMYELDGLGISITRGEDGLTATLNKNCDDAKFSQAVPMLREIGASNFTQFDFSDSGRITDLTLVKYFTAVTELDLSRTDVTDLSPLSGLTALTELKLPDTRVTDLSPLNGHTTLRRLDLSDDHDLSDVSALKGLTGLTQLDLPDTRVTDLKPLEYLPALRQLDLSNDSALTNLSALSGLSELTSLDLSDDGSVTDLTPLGRLIALTQLDLPNTGIRDLNPLSDLIALKILDISDDDSVADLTPLKGLTGLGILNLTGLGYTDVSGLNGLSNLRISCSAHSTSLLKLRNGSNPCSSSGRQQNPSRQGTDQCGGRNKTQAQNGRRSAFGAVFNEIMTTAV